MVKWPHTYFINVWYGGYASEDTACIYRTNNLDDFITHVEVTMEKEKLDSSNSRTIVRGDNTFFSFYKDFGESAWTDMRYFSDPDKSFSSFDDYKKYAYRERRVNECQDSRPQPIYSMS